MEPGVSKRTLSKPIGKRVFILIQSRAHTSTNRPRSARCTHSLQLITPVWREWAKRISCRNLNGKDVCPLPDLWRSGTSARTGLSDVRLV